MCPVPKDITHPTNMEHEAIKGWEHKDTVVGCILSFRLPDWITLHLDAYPMAKTQWDWLIEKFGQPQLEDNSKEKELTGEPPVTTGRGGGQQRRRKGKSHTCGEEGHRAHDCCTPKEGPATAPAAEEPSGATEQPKTSPADAIHTADLEGEDCSVAKEGITHAQIVVAEVDLSQWHTQDPVPKVHTQTIGAETEAIPGKPGAIERQPGDWNANTPKGVAHAELDSTPGEETIRNANTPEGVAHTELDFMSGEVVNPKTDARVHLEGAGPDVLVDEEDDQLLEVEENGATRKTASVEGDMDPRVELQMPGVSYLATQENARSFTLSPPPPPPPTTSEAASMQRSPAVNAGTLAIPEPNHSANLEPQPHNTPPPDEGMKTSTDHPPQQIRVPTDAGGLLESLRGEQTRCTMGQMGPTPAHALEGKPLIGEAHSRPPDLPDPQTQGSIVWEPESINSKTRVHTTQVRRPILDEGARVHPDPWPSLGVVTINLDVCSWSASQLEGEQNIHIPCVGSELHAAPSAPQTSTFSPFPPDAPTHENPPEEGAATERRATDYRHPEPWKPPDAQAEDLQEAGGVPSVPGNSPAFPENIDPFGLAGVVANVDAEEVEPSSVDAHERGGTLPVVGAATALAEGTASVEPAGEAQRATVAKSEALVPWAQGVAKREVERPWREDERELEAPLQTGRHKREALPPEGERERGITPRGDEGALGMPPRKYEREHIAPPRRDPKVMPF